MSRWFAATLLTTLILAAPGCGGGDAAEAARPGRGHSRGAAPDRRGGERAGAAVPVEVVTVTRRDISSFIETNGILEAENEVDVVARTSGPIVELLVEEGDFVRKGQLLARLDELEHRAQLEISRVTLEEMRLAHERAKTLQLEELISPESFEQARSSFESAQAQVEASGILLGYTQVRAPFDGLIVARYVDFAEQLSSNAPMFRISDFDPLLCPIQVPERELSRLEQGQTAYLTVEPFPGQRFGASVLRISPVVDSATGTIKVTLDVDARQRLRPGMFARVFVETERRAEALVVPKSALSLESIGDTVYVALDGVASRREVEIGFREGDFVEIASGVEVGEAVVLVGQDGLSDGTPIQVLSGGSSSASAVRGSADSAANAAVPPAGHAPDGERRAERPDLANMTDEQLEKLKQSMRSRGMTDEQIDERIKRMRERAGAH
jgi:membrane fusion protein (multidrug efflux system)